MFDHADSASRARTEPAHTTDETLGEHGTLGDLVRSAREGDAAAWQTLHSRFHPLLRSIVVRYRLPEADAADAIQATWTKCFERLASLREPAALPGWLSTVCRHEAIGILKAKARCLPIDYQDDETSRVLATPDTTVSHALAGLAENQPQAILHALLDDLDERDQNLMWALTAEDVTYRRIASALEMPIGSIGPTRKRIIARLQRKARSLELAA